MTRQSLKAVARMCAPWLLVPLVSSAGGAIELGLPIDCEVGRSCLVQNYVDHDASPNAKDYQCGTLSYDGHNGTDFRLPTLASQRAGVNVLAAAEGQVLRARDGMADIVFSASGAPPVADRECGNGMVVAHADGWETQYCHLAQGSVRVKAGERLAAGQPLGRVGLSGKTEFPHLHLTVRHRGTIIDPFAFEAPAGSCGGGTSLWSPPLRPSLAYRDRSVINTGFAPAPVTMDQIEAGEAGRARPGRGAEALIAFVRAIGLKLRDVQHLSVRGPDGQIVAAHTEAPLDNNKAQSMMFVGKRRPSAGGWPAGQYEASYRVTQDNRVVLEQNFAFALD
jgi:Peptidase family M23